MWRASVTRVLTVLMLWAAAAAGQEYPGKPIRIVTSGLGGGNDFVSRVIAQGIAGPLGQPVTVENRGGSVTVPGEAVAKAPPDGYTLLLIGTNFWITPFRQKVPYDPIMGKLEIVENPDFTRAYERVPVEHRMRVIVTAAGGERLVGESGGDDDDLSGNMSDKQINEKFRGLTEEFLGAKRASAILERLWHLEELKDAAAIPSALVIV